MSYIGVDEKLLSKYCTSNKLCFWSYVALINPVSSEDAYFFDCSLYKLVKAESKEHPDTRLLLAFKSPISLSQLYFTGQLHYEKLPEAPCSKEEIESYIKGMLEEINGMIEEASSLIEKPSAKERFLRLLIPTRGDKATMRGVYYGLLVRRSFISEMVSRLGYMDGLLKASVRAVYVLHSVDLSKKGFIALVCDKGVKLGAHNKIVDLDALLKTLKAT